LIKLLNLPLSCYLLLIVAEECTAAEVASDNSVVAGHLHDAIGVRATSTVASQGEVMQALSTFEVNRVR